MPLIGVISAYVIIFIMLAGSVFNFFGAFVSFRKNLRKNQTFVFYGFRFIIDLISFWPIGTVIFSKYILNYDLFDKSLMYCKIGHYLYFSVYMSSTWIIVSNLNLFQSILLDCMSTSFLLRF